jgi:ABC-type lipoprotein export system ATPase subunit
MYVGEGYNALRVRNIERLMVVIGWVGTSLLHGLAAGYAEAGSITAIMGPSGSGKSTLLNAIAGQYH